MVYIPSGTFMMGSPENEEKRNSNESPQHLVKITGFYMSKYPITQKQYQIIMGNNPVNFKGENKPVEQVYWKDAVNFCKQLSKRTRKQHRLPSEAEWEYACRAGTITPFYFGESITTDLANYNGKNIYASESRGQYREQTTEVGIFPPNAFGLYDMHGNVWEWCADPWHYNYKNAPIDGSVYSTEKSDKYRVLRGGSWFYNPFGVRTALRGRGNASIRNHTYGFRIVSLVL